MLLHNGGLTDHVDRSVLRVAGTLFKIIAATNESTTTTKPQRMILCKLSAKDQMGRSPFLLMSNELNSCDLAKSANFKSNDELFI